MNGEYIKKMTLEQFHEFAVPYYEKSLKKQYNFLKISELLQTRCEVLGEIPEMIDFLDELPEYSIDMYVHKKMKTNYENSLASLEKVLPKFEKVQQWNFDTIQEVCMSTVAELGVKNGIVLWPVRTAVSGKQFTPGGAFEIAEIIGKDETIKRMNIGIEKLKAAQM